MESAVAVAELDIQQNQKKYIFIDRYAVIQQYQSESFINSFKMLSTNHIEIYCYLRLAIIFEEYCSDRLYQLDL